MIFIFSITQRAHGDTVIPISTFLAEKILSQNFKIGYTGKLQRKHIECTGKGKKRKEYQLILSLSNATLFYYRKVKS